MALMKDIFRDHTANYFAIPYPENNSKVQRALKRALGVYFPFTRNAEKKKIHAKISKSIFGSRKVEYLGFILGDNGNSLNT